MILAGGLYLQMCGIDFLVNRFLHENRKINKAWHFFVPLIFIFILLIWIHVPIIVFALIIYGIILIYLHRFHKRTELHAIRGITSIIIMTVMEFVFLFYSQKGYHADLGDSIRIEYSIYTTAIVLLMIMVQLSVTIIGEIWRLRKRKSRFFYMAVLVKRVMEAVGCYCMVETTAFSDQSILFILMFLLSVLLDYYIIYDAKVNNVFRTEEVRRSHMPLNREAYYARMEEEHLQIRSMFHDMKNQLMILEGNSELQSEPAKRIVASTREKLNALGSFYHTGNSDLDLILFDCRNRAKERNIDFDAVIQEGCLSFMEQEDINNIFINSIVNAIEACSQIEEGEKSIKIHAGSRLNDVMISVKNTRSNQNGSNRLKTSKKDKKLHGLGIPSIQRSADKYQGYVSISEDNQYFQLVILFVRED